MAGAAACWGTRSLQLFQEVDFVGRPCRRGSARRSVPAHCLAVAYRIEADRWRTPHPGLALPLGNAPIVLRCLGHEEPVREARGAAELAAGWARRERAD
eukprot:8385684-Alexandrium_andersonii.AAC.1